MKLILLSGGSGRRLWPLSNDSRSKQFLKVLKDQDGKLQSMVQRVWGQIAESGLEDSAYIATSKAQYDIIQSQLGTELPIILEPLSNDTFPAIALAATYLYSVVKASLNEVIVIMPVDPYVELDFFTRLKYLEQTIIESQADLALIGVKPTYPSEKYGYIVPEHDTTKPNSSFYKVNKFVEKPNKEKAEELIKQSSLWNCGVFGFKLKYLISILEQKGMPTNFDEMQQYYSKMPKISFDFEVVEKADSIVTIMYEGLWKDLGTWNTLTEEMNTQIFGKGIMSNSSQNTHIVNELDIPIVVTGVNNLIVAASPDGILVAEKESSAQLKEVIKDLDQRPMYEERRWGWYKVLDYTRSDTGEEILTKRICIASGNNLSYQVHQKRSEVWTIVKGLGEIVLEDQFIETKPGDVFQVPKGMKHSIKAVTDLEIIEVQYGEELIEDDILRIELSWEEIEKLIRK